VLQFQVDPRVLVPTLAGDDGADALAPTSRQLAVTHALVPNIISVLGFDVRVSMARAGGVMMALAALGTAGWLALVTAATLRGSEWRRIQARYGGLIVPISGDPIGFARVVEVAAFDDLARFANVSTQAILYQIVGSVHQYVVRDGDCVYRYRIDPARRPVNVTLAPESAGDAGVSAAA
jgi:hypothetical protein